MKLPQLHLRDLFWMVLVAAMACAGWMVRSKLIAGYESRLDEQEEQLQLDAGTIYELHCEVARLKSQRP